MNPTSSPALDSSTVLARLGMCAAAVSGIAAAPAVNAAVVSTFANTTISIPQTTFGVYLNLLTGATGTTSSAVTGWDFNPYLSNGGTQLGFYWQTTAGGVATTAAAGPYLNLAPGATVSSSSTFARAINATVAFQTAGTHILGFEFFNEATSATNYGYLTMTNGATAGAPGFPATITGWVYDNSGASITIPAASAVSEPSTLMLSMGALALGAVNLRRMRRKQRKTIQ